MLPVLLHNGHKRTFKWSYRWNHELKVKTNITQISCDAKSICFNPFTRCYNTFGWGGVIVVPNCLHGRHDSAHLGDGKCIYHFTPLTAYSDGSCVNNLLSLFSPPWKLRTLTLPLLGTINVKRSSYTEKNSTASKPTKYIWFVMSHNAHEYNMWGSRGFCLSKLKLPNKYALGEGFCLR